MIDLTTPIIPYVGNRIVKLNSSYDEIKNFLQENNILYWEEFWKKIWMMFLYRSTVIALNTATGI